MHVQFFATASKLGDGWTKHQAAERDCENESESALGENLHWVTPVVLHIVFDVRLQRSSRVR